MSLKFEGTPSDFLRRISVFDAVSSNLNFLLDESLRHTVEALRSRLEVEKSEIRPQQTLLVKLILVTMIFLFCVSFFVFFHLFKVGFALAPK
jgi:hypothetical protein